MPEQEPLSPHRAIPDDAPDAAALEAGVDADRGLALPTATEPRPIAAPPATPPSATPPSAAVEALRLVADASTALASSLDLDDVLAAVGRIAVPRLADVCVLDLIDGRDGRDGRAERHLMATAYDAETEAAARDYLRRYPAGAAHPAVARRLAFGDPVVMRDLDDAHYRSVARTPEQLALLRRFHPRGAVVVPLRARGRTLGAMSLVSTGVSREPSDADLTLARELGHRVAQAVLNARLFSAARRSEDRLALALDGAEQGFWDWDLAANRVWVDWRLGAMLGRRREELGDDPRAWSTLIHPADLTRVRTAIREHLAGRAPAFESEHRLRHADGTWRWVLSRGRVVERDAAGRPRRVAGTHTDVTTRRRATETREVLARTVDASGDLVCTLDRDGMVTYVNPAGLRLLGAAALGAVRGRHHTAFLTDADRGRIVAARHEVLDGSGTWTGELRVRRDDGRPPVSVEARVTAVRDADTGELIAVAAVMHDLTERETAAAERDRLAEQARHAQRIESLGVLAGGVAHDFNNLLTVILSTVDLVHLDLPRGHVAHADLDVIRGAAARASQLTRQLLTFSRRQVLETRLLDLNAAIGDAHGLFRRLLGEHVAFDVSLAPQPLPVRADPVQLEQVLVNLVLNARDAVAQRPDGEGGVIAIETEEATLAGDDAARHGLPPGRYASVVVHDTGVGMDEATRRRIFEPFFTTKGVGEGTGLGLAMVYGIVSQSGGAIDVESAPDRGSTFRVYLPRVEAEVVERQPAAEPPVVADRGRETVLIVEDEASVRDIARRILERAGYTVLEARHGADALLVWREQGGAIDVLLTDVRMPELGGRELAAALRRERPDLPVVFVSGYLQELGGGVARMAPDGNAERFVAKPFVAPELRRAVRQVLDASRNAA